MTWTPEQRAAAKERCEQATAGPWVYDCIDPNVYTLDDMAVCTISESVGDDPAPDRDGDFISHARTDLPLAIAEIERLERGLLNIAATSVRWAVAAGGDTPLALVGTMARETLGMSTKDVNREVTKHE